VAWPIFDGCQPVTAGAWLHPRTVTLLIYMRQITVSLIHERTWRQANNNCIKLLYLLHVAVPFRFRFTEVFCPSSSVRGFFRLLTACERGIYRLHYTTDLK